MGKQHITNVRKSAFSMIKVIKRTGIKASVREILKAKPNYI